MAIGVVEFSNGGYKIRKKLEKDTKKFQKPKSCRQLLQHLIHTSYSIFLHEKLR